MSGNIHWLMRAPCKLRRVFPSHKWQWEQPVDVCCRERSWWRCLKRVDDSMTTISSKWVKERVDAWEDLAIGEREAHFIMRMEGRIGAKTNGGQRLVRKCVLDSSSLSKVDQWLKGWRRSQDWKLKKGVQWQLWALWLGTLPDSLISASGNLYQIIVPSTAECLIPKPATIQLILVKTDHEDWTRVCIQILPDIWEEIEKFMQPWECFELSDVRQVEHNLNLSFSFSFRANGREKRLLEFLWSWFFEFCKSFNKEITDKVKIFRYLWCQHPAPQYLICIIYVNILFMLTRGYEGIVNCIIFPLPKHIYVYLFLTWRGTYSFFLFFFFIFFFFLAEVWAYVSELKFRVY